MYQLAGGDFFLPATTLLILTVIIADVVRRRWLIMACLMVQLVAITIITLSAAALPWWFYAVWAIALLTWLVPGLFKYWKCRRAIRAVVVLCTLVAAGMELSYRRLRPLPTAHFPRLIVVGDSITAGLGRAGETTWPVVLRSQHGVQIFDLSRAGCTVRQAANSIQTSASFEGVVLIEVGGNDVIGHTNPSQFASDLENLAGKLQGPRNELVMFELPLFPFDNAYGIIQRDIARRYNIRLIPRRFLAAIFAGPGNTIDGIHLSNAGQLELAKLIWTVVGPALEG